MYGYELIARQLVAEGVDTVFAVMGDGNLHLLAELGLTHGIRIVHARHEQGAVSMADGYSRFTGQLGVATVTHGPGMTNTATSLATAVAHRSRVLLIVGGLAAHDVDNLQQLDQSAFAASLGADRVALTTPSRVGADLDRALRIVLNGRRTVVLDAATDIQTAETGITTIRSGETRITASAPAPSRELAEQAARILGAAKRPIIVAGRGASSNDAISAIGKLAVAIGAPVVTSLLGKGNFSSHPNSLGVAGGLGDPAASHTLATADCVLSIGASLNDWTTTRKDFVTDATIIQIDVDPLAFGRFVDPALAILSDAACAALAITEYIVPSAPPLSWRPPARDSAGDDLEYDDGANTVDPRRACLAIENALPRDRAVVVDGGHACIWGAQLVQTHMPRSFTHGFSFGSIGQSLSLALGAAAGLNGRRVAAIMGDGSAAMSIAELETAVRENLPVAIVVLNDGGFGIERHTLALQNLPVAESNYPSPNFADLARAAGASAITVSSVEDLSLIPQLLQESGPVLIDLRVNGGLIADTFLEIKQLHR
ncbi:thiamine pyrophosphate-binding protein [Salinibacterium sp. TMP30]|uniref:thiamine pyrophosphate-binding protein n=1 Tax=Salinibacterium sp. TMP30 TaxID=3138237 RepID=UPI003138C8B8